MKTILKLLQTLTLVTVFAVAGFFIFDKLDPIDTKAMYDTSRIVKYANGTWMYATTNQTQKWRFAVDLDKIDPNFIQLLLSYEDQRFFTHYGVDPLAMGRAVGQLIRHKKVISGGSTVTMQLARLLHPRERTVSSKLIEIVRALQLELHYSKEEILSAYLTLAPYGGNVEGIIAASMRYFGKYPYALSASQMALLVAMPQSPESNRPDRHYARSINARNKVLLYAKNEKLIGDYEYKQALTETLPRSVKAFPRHAPHLSQKLLKRSKEKTIHTTLNALLQTQLEHWAFSKESKLDKESTLAVLVVRNSDASVQAYLGSHNMFSKRVSGYVDMIPAIRSPGSTLKPFIYGYGFEKHVIHPNTKILDKETRFGDYMPHNFSYDYSGEVTMSYALQNSLNIPAVKILNKVGVEDFVGRLSSVSGALHIPKQYASLPIALGGVGLSLWQLSQLYVALANEGRANTLHYLPQEQNASVDKILFDTQTAKMTTAILRETPAPEGFTNKNQQIAYKTGTSYGYRDAWTMGYTKDYTVAMWVGKPDNSIQLKKTGRTAAAPLAFEVFSLLHSLGMYESWDWSASYLGSHAPEGLQHFDTEVKEEEATLAFLYPSENERFMSADCSDAIVEVMVENGKAPYFWYIDEEAKAFTKNRFNIPFSHGGHTINVIDSSGETISRHIWVNKPEC